MEPFLFFAFRHNFDTNCSLLTAVQLYYRINFFSRELVFFEFVWDCFQNRVWLDKIICSLASVPFEDSNIISNTNYSRSKAPIWKYEIYSVTLHKVYILYVLISNAKSPLKTMLKYATLGMGVRYRFGNMKFIL